MFPKTFRTSRNMGTSSWRQRSSCGFPVWHVIVWILQYSICLGFFLNGICERRYHWHPRDWYWTFVWLFSPISLSRWTETAVVSMIAIVIVPGSAESDEECSRPSVKSSKQIRRSMWKLIDLEILRGKNCKNLWYFLSLYRVVNLPPMNRVIAKLKDLKSRSGQFRIFDAVWSCFKIGVSVEIASPWSRARKTNVAKNWTKF